MEGSDHQEREIKSESGETDRQTMAIRENERHGRNYRRIRGGSRNKIIVRIPKLEEREGKKVDMILTGDAIKKH